MTQFLAPPNPYFAEVALGRKTSLAIPPRRGTLHLRELIQSHCPSPSS
jgi:hypothetical protein